MTTGLTHQIQIHAEAHKVRFRIPQNETVNKSGYHEFADLKASSKALKLASPFHRETEIAAPIGTKGNKGDGHEDHQSLRRTFIAL
ncbi:hypothetical protein M413DRAFT_81271 [Hebeloma cylindrosporum]|uniref:Uncharacterized protein n=1 Tax=Hebeloma cylindrosporum TaxID=76867 RepID=A0A0C3CXL9_HEBCY|nr:hypothetical protein M413DRAFT_81271 [Hebeloma cylindrosporum h7]